MAHDWNGSAARSPELEFLGKSETVHRLWMLLSESQKFVMLVSPYLSIEKLRDLERYIQGALKRKVAVTLVIRARDAHTAHMSANGHQRLQVLKQQGLQLFEVSDLHAKLYISERHALVTSLNLLDSSFNNSIEIGMWVPGQRPEYAQIMKFFQTEVRPHARPMNPQIALDEVDFAPRRATSAATGKRTSSRKKIEAGFCIRCGDELPLNLDKPYCPDDYASWAAYGNPNYRDNFCHGCGEECSVTKNKPLCRDCYEEYEDQGIPF